MDLWGIIAGAANTPIPNLLTIAGTLFLFLAVVGKIGANVVVNPQRQKLAAVLGAILLSVGVMLHLASRTTSPPREPPPQAPVAAPEPELAPRQPAIAAAQPPQPPPPRSAIEQALEAWSRGDYDSALDQFAALAQEGDDPAARDLARRRLDWLGEYRGRILIADDFETDTTGERWSLHQPGAGTGSGEFLRVSEDGNFVLEGRGHFHARASDPRVIEQDFEVRLRFKPVSGNRGAAHINIAMDDPRGRSTIGLYPADQNVSVWEEIGGRRTEKSARLALTSRWHELRADVQGPHLHLLLDGREVLRYTSPRPRMILRGFNLETLAATMRFDDVLVNCAVRCP